MLAKVKMFCEIFVFFYYNPLTELMIAKNWPNALKVLSTRLYYKASTCVANACYLKYDPHIFKTYIYVRMYIIENIKILHVAQV